MMPAFPLASNLAEGLLMISILSMADAGKLSNPVCPPKPVNAVCFPSSKTSV